MSAAYQQYAAQGTTDVPAPDPVVPIVWYDRDEPAPFVPAQTQPLPPAPQLQPGERPNLRDEPALRGTRQPNAHARTELQTVPTPSITRIVIPSIALDSKIVEVGWVQRDDQGTGRTEWQVATYAVGHHRTSGQPGDGTNIVLAGHVGGLGAVFRDLYAIPAHAYVLLYTGTTAHRYQITHKIIVTEQNATVQEQQDHAQFIAPTANEQVILGTCWPATGPTRFTQRLIVQAVPAPEANTAP